MFEFGFFSPGTSSNRYIGIWYKIDPATVVWVANRLNPINDSSGILILDNTGNLTLVSKNKSVIWSSNLEKIVRNPVAQLLDSGNLVIRDEKESDSERFLWQSFDYPSDTLLPGMKIGWDVETGLNRRLSAWKNLSDPSPGDFTWGMVLSGNPEGFLWKGSKKYYRSSPWNGIGNSGSPNLKENQLYEFSFISNEKEVYYTYNLKNRSAMSRIVLNQTSYLRERYTWNEESRTWELYTFVPRDYCDRYGLCGPYGNCISTESPVCQCLKGFVPASPENWNSADWSHGCVRNNPLKCHNGEGFVKFVGLKLPDTTSSWVNRSMNLKECRAKCLQNCSCIAYTTFDVRAQGSGCAIWFGDLNDMRTSKSGQDLYVRMSASDLEEKIEPKKKIMIIVAIVVTLCFGMLIICYCVRKSKARVKEKRESEENDDKEHSEQEQQDLELPLLDLTAITNSTNNFSNDNKLGEGGFGPVYKGTLMDGQEIAVKRLSKNSGQGLQEFKNEVILIAKLQHRNLVKLLGCCIQGDEKILIYEYMPNKSLDNIIFDQRKGDLLDWSKRFNIICGIARGLLYLHQDSRLRIIHRDLKASNVLLDKDMNPKISDFGMARTFGGDQTEGNTNRVVGT
ncbi:G-type lectin S-receptor-like serine/threonine-protein kinase At4g27290 [Jatropha curcas]|uniref:G-type lectin S-receptor-like serine/threonine-protein kinase At4g27290 n=1 Tax=Jatropha curcas TaxID=180498 RepID=UPI001895C68A|nr:G-type lectin S-receptor-like serine/threonine-protein kinase At4g27290 [Jatropha curcas]